MSAPNKHSGDWALVKTKLNEMVATAFDAMIGPTVDIAEYNFLRGQIVLAKELIEWVEPTTPPVTTEDNYGISDPE